MHQRNWKKQEPALYQLSDDSGALLLTKIQEASTLDWADLKENEVFIVDVGSEIFIWVGDKASMNEKVSAFRFAEGYAKHVGKEHAKIIRCAEGGEPHEFKQVFGK